jgi:hypothetical protein
MNRKQEANKLQDEIDQLHLAAGRSPLKLAPLYREMRDERRWEDLGYKDFDDWIDNYSQRRWHHGRSRVYALVSTMEKIEKSFEPAATCLMLYENAEDIVRAFGDCVPEKLRTAEFVRADSELPNDEFREYLDKAQPNLHMPEKPQPKTFQLTPRQTGTVRHAINKVKNDEGAVTDAEALEIMAQDVIKQDVRETALDPILDLLRRINAADVDRSLHGRESPTGAQWKEIAEMSERVMDGILTASAEMIKA